jgi:hypothetical protein
MNETAEPGEKSSKNLDDADITFWSAESSINQVITDGGGHWLRSRKAHIPSQSIAIGRYGRGWPRSLVCFMTRACTEYSRNVVVFMAFTTVINC